MIYNSIMEKIMAKERFQISARSVIEKMDKATDAVLAGKTNVNVGSMVISEYKVILATFRLQLEQSKITGKPMENPLVNMD